MIKLGSKVRDIITGVEGIAVAKTDYLTGCTRYQVQRKAGKDGKIPELLHFDVEQIKLVKAGAVKIKSRLTSGGANPPDRTY